VNLPRASLPQLLRTQFELHVGRGYQTFGEFAAARTWLVRAVRSASEHSFNQFLFEAESALADNQDKGTPRPTTTPFEISDDVNEIVAELKEMREMAGV